MSAMPISRLGERRAPQPSSAADTRKFAHTTTSASATRERAVEAAPQADAEDRERRDEQRVAWRGRGRCATRSGRRTVTRPLACSCRLPTIPDGIDWSTHLPNACCPDWGAVPRLAGLVTADAVLVAVVRGDERAGEAEQREADQKDRRGAGLRVQPGSEQTQERGDRDHGEALTEGIVLGCRVAHATAAGTHRPLSPSPPPGRTGRL